VNRRDLIKAAAVAPAVLLPAAYASPVPAALETKILRLNLQHTWTTTMSSSAYRDTLHVAYSRDGITGHGEGAPIVRYHEDAEGARKAVESVRDLILAADPMHFSNLMADVFKRVPGEWAGKAAIDIAIMDWVGQKLGIPLYEWLGLDPAGTPLTTFSIGIDTPEITKQKTREAADYPILKVKVGLSTDEPTIEAVRSVTDKKLRVDANEGWTNKEGRPQNQLAGAARCGIHRAAHAGRDDRRDALGAQPGTHPHHRRRSLPAGLRHPQTERRL
jgi:L-alanine-DL-glutamate epimerase-like enolase superfamily enzyme